MNNPSPIIINVNSATAKSKASALQEDLQFPPKSWEMLFNYIENGCMLHVFNSGRMIAFSDGSMLLMPTNGINQSYDSPESSQVSILRMANSGDPLAIEIITEANAQAQALQQQYEQYMQQEQPQ